MRSEEIELSFEWDGLRLTGSLHVPDAGAAVPVVLMMQGSGPADRDSGGYFVPIRQVFLDRGVATYAFDKPGCGGSDGDWHNHGLVGRAGQADRAMEMLRKQPLVDAARVGIWGHSQSGWLVQMLAGRSSSLAFAIASSAPTITVEEQILYDLEHGMRHRGLEDDAVREALDLSRALFQAAVAGEDFESVARRLLQPAADLAWFHAYPAVGGVHEWRHLGQLLGEPFNPLDALRRVDCPFLAVYGYLDALLPASEGVEESELALAESPSADVTVVGFPDGDHRLQVSGSEAFADGYLELLGDWIAARIGGARS
ncbi:MAG: alpha/beta fold hydrolase [Actinomycetota bacterium]